MKKSVKAILCTLAVCICICTAALVLYRISENEPSETPVTGGSNSVTAVTDTNESPVLQYKNQSSGFEFTDMFSYSGEYVEDGSGETVENIAAVKIKNISGDDCRYAEAVISTKDGDFEFSFTTLKSGETVTVLEKNKKPFSHPSGTVKITVNNKAVFSEAPSLYEDVFELTVSDRILNIKNISGEDIGGPVYVYYKNTENGELFGGITYRIAFDGLSAGELKQFPSEHLKKDTSIIEFITYAH